MKLVLKLNVLKVTLEIPIQNFVNQSVLMDVMIAKFQIYVSLVRVDIHYLILHVL